MSHVAVHAMINGVDASMNDLGITVESVDLLDSLRADTPVAVENLILRGELQGKFTVIALDAQHPIVQIGDLILPFATCMGPAGVSVGPAEVRSCERVHRVLGL